MTKSDRDLPSNVYKLWNRYYIAQTRNGEKKVYGRYDTREEHELTNHEEVIQLRITIEDIVNSYTQLCDLFGDIMD